MSARWDLMTKWVAAALAAGALGLAASVAMAQQQQPADATAAPTEERQVQVEPSGAKPEEAPPAETTAAQPEAEKKDAAEAAPEATPPEPDSATAEATPPEPDSDVAAPEINAPADPVAKAAFDALEKHCARCHQAGQLAGRQKPAKNFGNVLALDEIVRDPNLILPGNPDGSRLFIQIAKQEMPYDVFQEFSGGPEPTKDEVQAVYDWIKSLDKTVVAACGDRKPISTGAIVDAIAEDIDNQQEHRRKGMRYITLSHLYNACTDEKDMVRFRQGVVKLLNSLSRESDVLKMRTIDEEKTIIAFNLEDLKWDEAKWNRLIAAYPYAVKPDSNEYETVKRITNTPMAWVRGDWFAFSASRPPLYYDLLDLPEDFAGLEKQVGVDVEKDIENFLAKRAGFQKSGVSKHNRLIERHSINTGYFWTSYDFKGDKPEQSLFVHPLGPKGDDAFKHDGGETIFSLPNGFQAYYLNVAAGKRLDKGPTEIVLDDSQLDRAVTNGISCFGCHNQGMRRATDDVRKHVIKDRTFSKDVREKVEALYPPVEEMNKVLDEDYNRFHNAMLRAGLNPELDSKKVGVESINFLSKQYEKAVDLRLAAAEYGITSDELSEGLGAAGGEAFRTRRRLEQGVLPREILEERFTRFVENVSDDEAVDLKDVASGKHAVAKVGGKTKEQTHDFDLALFSDKSEYGQNDLAVFSVRSKADCHLTLINVDGNGDGTVIFPNKFQQDNFLPAGKELRFPGDHAKFQFRLKDKGKETVIAVCNSGGKTADGIKHDFKTRSFTSLGDYQQFLTRQIVVEGAQKVAEGQKAKDSGKEASTPKEILARTAITFAVD